MTVDIASLLIPLLLTAAALWALGRRVDVYDALTAGASEGLTVLLRIVPSLIALLTAVYMFRASGALDLLTELLAPVLEKLGRASYNIFLVQILYYNYVNLKLTEYIPNFYVHIAVNVLVCVGMGLAFYSLESSLRKRIKKTS